ncbi:MAG: FTR1 family iron permease, partial [Stenotrophobium sp.]
WMAGHGRQMAAQMNQVGREVTAGSRSMVALLLVIALAVLREGSEVVLFLYGIALGGSRPLSMAAGGVLGVIGGAGVGLVLYHGLLRIPMRHFFTVTSWLILLLAAGMASQAANFLVQADLLPALGTKIWDTSGLVSAGSLFGQTLHTLIGYDPRPAGMQLLFYVLTLVIIGIGMKLFAPGSKPAPRKIAAAALVLGASAMLGTLVVPDRAYAAPSDHVYRPIVEYRESELEFKGGYLHDSDPALNTTQSYNIEVGHGFTPWWYFELNNEFIKDPNQSLKPGSIEFENIFQPFDQGRYWADIGFFVEYEQVYAGSTPNNLTYGLLLEKQISRAVTTLDLLAHNEVGMGAGSGTDYQYRTQTQWHTGNPVDFGWQGFGTFGHDSTHNWGPAIFGMTHLGGNAVKYDAAVLAGLGSQSPSWIARWKVEYEFY